MSFIPARVRGFFLSQWQPPLVLIALAALQCLGGFLGLPWIVAAVLSYAFLASIPVGLLAVAVQFDGRLWRRGAGTLLAGFLAFGFGSALMIVGNVAYWTHENPPESPGPRELPLNKQSEARIRRLLEEIRAGVPAETSVRSIEYRFRDDKRTVNVAFGCRQQGVDFSAYLSFIVANGRLQLKREPTHRNAVKAMLAAAAEKRLASATDGEALSWPILEDMHAGLVREMSRLAALYVANLREELGDKESISAEVEAVDYVDPQGERIGKGDILVWFRLKCPVVDMEPLDVSLVYANGKFRLIEAHGPQWSPSIAAKDNAVSEWLATAGPDSIVDASIPEGKGWFEVSGDLPDSEGRIVLAMHSAHPFLAEYDRKVRLEMPDRPAKTFPLPMCLGGGGDACVYLIEHGGKRYLRLKDPQDLDVVMRIDTLKFASRDAYPQGRLVGAFVQTAEGLAYVDVTRNRKDARRLFQAEAERGYNLPLRALEALEKSEAAGK